MERPSPARAASLRRRLLRWYDAHQRALPWRFPQHGADPYRVWISEVMLQQTQVARVLDYYPRFLAAFPTLAALAEADEAAVLRAWAGLGYYARARALHRAAREAQARHGGLPDTLEALAALPGFGPYTAGAVASIAFARAAPAVDGNVARLLSRLFLVDTPAGRGPTTRRLWALASALAGGPRPGDLTQALIELGATVCVKPAPRCARCPLARDCAARRAGREREVPPPKRRPKAPALELACALVVRRGRVLLARRPREGLFGGLWALPSIEVPAGASAEAALARALTDGTGRHARVGSERGAVRRLLTHRRLLLRAFDCEIRGSVPRGRYRWVELRQLDEAGLPAAFLALLAASPPGEGASRPRKMRGGLGKRGDFQ